MFVLATALGLAQMGCVQTTRRPVNVLLVVIDTLREDHVGIYGGKRDTSPTMDRLASGAIRFTQAYAPSPWTKPSIASIFTGRFPSSHGVMRLPSLLSDDVSTLAERLADVGYATEGVVSHILLTAENCRFDQGFDNWTLAIDGEPHSVISTGDVTDRGLRALSEFADGNKPFFLFLHYFDPHYDYIRHPEYGFAPASVGAFEGNINFDDIWGLLDGPGLTDDEIQVVEAIYDEEIRHTDTGIAQLLEHLEELALQDDTLVIVTSDHGEEFLDHGSLGHRQSLYEELMRVPLIMRVPGEAGKPQVIDAPVSLVALAPTILDFLGVHFPKGTFQADSLRGLVNDGEAGGGEIFLEVDFGWYEVGAEKKDEEEIHKKAIVIDRMKLIRDQKTGALELYDLSLDSREKNNLAGERPDLVRKLSLALDRWIDRAGSLARVSEETTFTEEELEQLRSLGYVQ